MNATLLLLAAVNSAPLPQDEVAEIALRNTVASVRPGTTLSAAKATLYEPRTLEVLPDGRLSVSWILSKQTGTREVLVGIDGTLHSDGTVQTLEVVQTTVTQWITASQFGQVKRGMLEGALLKLLGPPESRYLDEGVEHLKYKMRSCDRPEIDMLFVTVRIKGGRVVGKEAVSL